MGVSKTTYIHWDDPPSICQGAGSSASLLDNSMASRLGLGEKLAESGENAKDVCMYNMYIYIYKHTPVVYMNTYNIYNIYL